jgi:hypothetical protein
LRCSSALAISSKAVAAGPRRAGHLVEGGGKLAHGGVAMAQAAAGAEIAGGQAP